MTRRARDVSDYGQPERGQHGDGIILTETGRAGVKRAYVTTQGPLGHYLAHGQLGGGKTAKRRHEAGNRLYALFYRAGLSNSVTGSYGVRIGGGGVEGYRILCLDAYLEYMQARDSLRAGAVDVIYSVCLLHEPAGRGARMEMLRLGLDDLTRHWRM